MVDISKSSVGMMATKVEIQLCKAEAGSWSKLEVPREVTKKEQSKKEDTPEPDCEPVDALDLDDLELESRNITLSHEASGGRTSARIHEIIEENGK